MILNAHTGSHDMYLRGKRRPVRRALRGVPKSETAAMPNGTLDEKCAWLKARMQRRRKKAA